MNYFLSLLLVASPLFALCQGEWQAIDLGAATSIHIEAALSAVSVTTGSGDRVRVLHELTIEGEDRADLRKLSVEVRDGVLHIKELSPTVEVIQEALPDRDNDQKGKALLQQRRDVHRRLLGKSAFAGGGARGNSLHRVGRIR